MFLSTSWFKFLLRSWNDFREISSLMKQTSYLTDFAIKMKFRNTRNNLNSISRADARRFVHEILLLKLVHKKKTHYIYFLHNDLFNTQHYVAGLSGESTRK